MPERYIYVGEGAGVPGLPHEVTDDQAEALGAIDILTQAIANGSYKLVGPEKKAKPAKQEGE